MEEAEDPEEPQKSIQLRCPACGYWLTELWGVDTMMLRLFCRERHCRRQCWFLLRDGRLVQASLGEIAIGALEKPVRMV